ncbi:MAG: cytidylyltransferase domain-containing protein [Alphaproteobacteria bacterium]
MKTWYMVPVRGGSRGVPSKNKKDLNGKPLMVYVIESILKIEGSKQIIVATDDCELKSIAEKYGVNIFMLPPQTGGETLDDVAFLLTDYLLNECQADLEDVFLTIQSTCPFIRPETILEAKKYFIEGAGSVVTAMDARHLHWQVDGEGKPVPAYHARLNRQRLPPFYRESGAIIGARIKDVRAQKTRVIAPINLLPIAHEEGIDIDDFNDWAIAENIVSKKKVIIKADSSVKIGMGHLYRSVALAYELAKHKPIIISNVSCDKSLSRDFFKDPIYQFETVESDDEFVLFVEKEGADLVIVDQLNTSAEYIKSLKKTGAKVVTFEDLGPGAKEADLLVSDLYRNVEISDEKQLHGVENAILNPNFEWVEPILSLHKKVSNILILFGGTDPSNLTFKTLKALGRLQFDGQVTLVQGIGKEDKIEDLERFGLQGEILNNVSFMPAVMKKADLAISSAGRTITELMTLGIPTLCVCQNEKEMTHTHASQAYGVLNLGLGALVTEDGLMRNIEFLIQNYDFRQQMNIRAMSGVKNRKSNREIFRRIEKRLGMSLL